MSGAAPAFPTEINARRPQVVPGGGAAGIGGRRAADSSFTGDPDTKWRSRVIKRPDPSEYFEYYGRYIDLVPEGDILSILEESLQQTLATLRDLPEELADYRYAPGKWSIKEVIGHVIDAERVFAYRAVSFARRDPARLPSMEQDEWADVSNAAQRPFQELLDELEAARRSTILLFKSFDEEMTALRGTASGCEFSVRCLPYIIAGHEIHHRKVIGELYLPAAS
jgi:uncharacterized damage-inducible protein DinB